MKPMPNLRALYLNPSTGNQTEVVSWDQSLGQLFDWIGDSYYWVTDRNNRIYHTGPEDTPLPGTVTHPRWTHPMRGAVLIVAIDTLTGADASLPLRDISAYRRQVRLNH